MTFPATPTGTRFIGTGGTGALPSPASYIGYDAIDTGTGKWYVVNSSGTAWVEVGNVNNANLGLLPLTGGTMTGAIGGASGLAPLDSPQFVTSAKRDGSDLATTSQLASTSTAILDSISPKITEAVAGLSTAISVKGSIAIGTGILTGTSQATVTIPLPYYSDGTQAAEADCKWTVGLASAGIPTGLSGSGQDTYLEYSADPTTTRTFQMYLRMGSTTSYDCKIAYMIIAVKP